MCVLLTTLSLGFALTGAAADFDKALNAYEKGDYKTALEEWRISANQGDASAQYNLGLMYANGQGVSQDDTEAAQWFRRAAEQDLVQAQLNLSLMYMRGDGVPQDYTKASQWVRRAAEQGDVKAQYNLSIMYYKGMGVTRNPVMAYVASNLAAAQGHQKARKNQDIIAKTLSREQNDEGQRMTSEWQVGTPLPYFKDFKTWP
jgi:hypothetical protein